MWRLTGTMLIAVAGMLALVASAPAQVGAPPKGGGDPPPVNVSFRNETKMTLLVRGSSIVKNNVVRRWDPVVIQDGKTGFDNNVPPGKRSVTIIDYKTNRPLLVNFQFTVPAGRDLPLVIRSVPNDPNRIILTPDQ
jgi:hypothetical protein